MNSALTALVGCLLLAPGRGHMRDVINSAQEEPASRFVQSVRVLSYHSVVNQLSRNCNYASWAHRAVPHVGIHVYMVQCFCSS